MRGTVPLLCLCLAMAGGASAAHAQEGEVGVLAAAGKQALLERRFEDARRLFREGLRVAATARDRWQLLLGVALAFDLEGNPVAAAHAYRTFTRDATGHPDAAEGKWAARRDQAVADLRRVEQKILGTRGKLDLQSDPSGSAVHVDGAPTAERTPAVLYLEPGAHRIELRAAGHEPLPFSLVIEVGQDVVLHRTLTALPAPPPPPPPPPSPTPLPPSPAPEPPPAVAPAPVAIPGALVLTTGAASFIAAAALTSAALRDASELDILQRRPVTTTSVDRDAQLRERVHAYERAYVSLYAIGGAAVAGGAALLLIDALGEPPVTAWIDPTGAGASWHGRF